MTPTPLYGSDPNEDIRGEPFPDHTFMSTDGTASCSYEWRNRPCTLAPEAWVHVGADATREFTMRVNDIERKVVQEEAEVLWRMAIKESRTAEALSPLFREALALAAAKDQAYAGAWVRQGYMGNTARVLSKVERLRELVWSDRVAQLGDSVGGETVEDTLLDLMNLAAMMLHNVRAGNRWGSNA